MISPKENRLIDFNPTDDLAITRQEKISGSNAISCVQELRTFN